MNISQIGGERCHDLEEMECIIPQLGSAPINDKVGSGFYSVSDYREILEKATQLHIEVTIITCILSSRIALFTNHTTMRNKEH